MPSSSALRQQIESSFQHRYPSVLTPAPRTIREVHPTGIPSLDYLLSGGLPVGAITELTGPASSGRTSIALTFISSRAREGSVCAWIDANDAFDPESAAANGVSLNHLLWVRCTSNPPSPTNPSSQNSLTQKSRPSNLSPTRPWTRLDQAIRATDLLLQSGGFSSIVLDLADEAPENARRIPLATWFRFRQAADRTRCTLIVLGKASCAQSSAAVVLECEHSSIESANKTVLRGFTFRASRKRERFSPTTAAVTSIDRISSIDPHTRKPPASTWSAPTAWNAARRA